MGWISEYLEAKRLEKKVKELENKISLLEADRSRLFNLVLERDQLFVDRFLTNQVKTFAIADEAKINLQSDADAEIKRQQSEFLSRKQSEWLRDAEEAGIPPNQAYQDFRKQEPILIEQFQQSLGFE